MGTGVHLVEGSLRKKMDEPRSFRRPSLPNNASAVSKNWREQKMSQKCSPEIGTSLDRHKVRARKAHAELSYEPVACVAPYHLGRNVLGCFCGHSLHVCGSDRAAPALGKRPAFG